MLLERGEPVRDPWRRIGDDAPLPDGHCIISLDRLLGLDAARLPAPLGVSLPPDKEPELLRDQLPVLALVALHFPIFRDGRAFTQARALREHLAFGGEIRATGGFLPDQYGFLLRCGVTTIEVADDADLAVWKTAAERFHVAYQPSVLDPAAAGPLRRFLRPPA